MDDYLEEVAERIAQRVLGLMEEEGWIPERTIRNYVEEVCYRLDPSEVYEMVIEKLESTGMVEREEGENGDPGYRYTG